MIKPGTNRKSSAIRASQGRVVQRLSWYFSAPPAAVTSDFPIVGESKQASIGYHTGLFIRSHHPVVPTIWNASAA